MNSSSSSTEALVEHFDHIFAQSKDILNLFSLRERRIIRTNAAAAQSLGYGVEELHSTPVERLYPPDEIPKLERAIDQLETQGFSSDKLKIYSKSGELRDIWTRSYVIQQEPEPICLVHTFDITEENRQAERAIHAAKLATLGETSAMIAHELANALQSIRFNLRLLSTELGSDLTGAVAARLDRLVRGVARMEAIVRGIQKYAYRTAAGGSFVSLAAIVDEALDIMKGYTQSKQITVSAHMAPDLPFIWADQGHVQHIVLILAKNAVQAMLNSKARRLSISAGVERDVVTLSVADTGIGIPPELQRSIFEAFATTKPAGIGLGMGLSLAKKLAEMNGIELNFSSGPESGTEFTMTFRPPHGPSLALHAPDRAPSSTREKTVLIVEDNADVLKAVSQSLEERGLRTVQATSAYEGLQILRAHTVDGVLCDVDLYPVSGREFAGDARRIYRGPIYLISGDPNEERQANGPGDGFSRTAGPAAGDVDVTGVLRKPFEGEALALAAQAMLGFRRGGD